MLYSIDAYLADRLTSDSWIEVSSQPSSSSLSSVADEIITTGLRVQHDSNARRRRRPRRYTADQLHTARRATGGTSSQDEYDESESESDRVMTSSNEGLQPSPPREQWRPLPGHTFSSASSENAYASDDEDENATAVGIQPAEISFTPQPNAFTLPQSQAARSQQAVSNPYFSTQRPTARSASQRHSYSSPPQHSPYNMISPSHEADHDAALRASLSTLLSCAAAARGLPKSNRSETQMRPPPSNRIDTTTLRMVPESVAMGTSEATSAAALPSSSRDHTVSRASFEKGKRKATVAPPAGSSAPRSSSKDQRAVKKARRTSSTVPVLLDDVSPTLMTWVVSAGVVVLVSAISFSAGYVYGKEIGRAEAGTFTSVRDAGRCGRDVFIESGSSGLKRLRWTGAASTIQV
jgi:hypothetical protein